MRDLPDCREQFSSIRRVGHVPALRWFGCGKRAGWASEVMLEACPRCGGELVERSERRQRWLQGHDRKRDALAALAAVVAEADRGGFYIEPSKRKLADFLVNDWLPRVRATIRSSTFSSYEGPSGSILSRPSETSSCGRWPPHISTPPMRRGWPTGDPTAAASCRRTACCTST